MCADHDWGWNNGNRRLPHKTEFKNLFLDALGEPASSPRRNANNGIQVCLRLGSKLDLASYAAVTETCELALTGQLVGFVLMGLLGQCRCIVGTGAGASLGLVHRWDSAGALLGC